MPWIITGNHCPMGYHHLPELVHSQAFRLCIKNYKLCIRVSLTQPHPPMPTHIGIPGGIMNKRMYLYIGRKGAPSLVPEMTSTLWEISRHQGNTLQLLIAIWYGVMDRSRDCQRYSYLRSLSCSTLTLPRNLTVAHRYRPIRRGPISYLCGTIKGIARLYYDYFL